MVLPDTLQVVGKWLLGGVIISSIAYEIIKRTVWNPVWAFVKSRFVIQRILLKNHPTRNAGGKYLADRMLDMWNNGTPTPLVSRKGVIYQAGGRWPSVYWESVVDETLQKEGLVVRYEEEGRWLARLSDSMLGKFVLRSLLKKVKKDKL